MWNQGCQSQKRTQSKTSSSLWIKNERPTQCSPMVAWSVEELKGQPFADGIGTAKSWFQQGPISWVFHSKRMSCPIQGSANTPQLDHIPSPGRKLSSRFVRKRSQKPSGSPTKLLLDGIARKTWRTLSNGMRFLNSNRNTSYIVWSSIYIQFDFWCATDPKTEPHSIPGWHVPTLEILSVNLTIIFQKTISSY